MATLKEPFALDRSLNTTEVTPRNIADVLAEGLSHITGRTASEVEYDNTDSGLTSDDVQGAIDELSERPTLPSVDIQTAVDEFSTYNGGLLSSLKVALSPNQDLHGYSEPWVGGSRKNKLPVNENTISGAGFIFDTPIDLPIGTWTFSFATTATSNSSFAVLDGDGNVVANVTIGSTQRNTTFTLNAIGKTARFYGYAGTYTDMQIESGSTATAYESYENICPISGHTEVDIDVSDGQATQEQITVNLGGTYYSGVLDVVSGVFVVDRKKYIIDGTENLTWYIDNAPSTLSNAYSKISDLFTDIMVAGYQTKLSFNEFKAVTSASNRQVGTAYIQNGYLNLQFEKNKFANANELKTWLGTNNLEAVAELATPTPIQLSPTMVKALVGENHLSAPLDGQEITESKYKQTFTFDDVIAYIQSLS